MKEGVLIWKENGWKMIKKNSETLMNQQNQLLATMLEMQKQQSNQMQANQMLLMQQQQQQGQALMTLLAKLAGK